MSMMDSVDLAAPSLVEYWLLVESWLLITHKIAISYRTVYYLILNQLCFHGLKLCSDFVANTILK